MAATRETEKKSKGFYSNFRLSDKGKLFWGKIRVTPKIHLTNLARAQLFGNLSKYIIHISDEVCGNYNTFSFSEKLKERKKEKEIVFVQNRH